jgi:hypothetical protein
MGNTYIMTHFFNIYPTTLCHRSGPMYGASLSSTISCMIQGTRS